MLTIWKDQKQARDLVNVLTEAKQQIDPRLAEMTRYGGGGGNSRWGGGGFRGGRGGGRGGGKFNLPPLSPVPSLMELTKVAGRRFHLFKLCTPRKWRQTLVELYHTRVIRSVIANRRHNTEPRIIGYSSISRI